MTDIQKLSGLKNVSKIIHCADIHIRNLRRHDEYRRQFNKFYDEIKKIKDDKKSSLRLECRSAYTRNTAQTDSQSQSFFQQRISDFSNQNRSIGTIVTLCSDLTPCVQHPGHTHILARKLSGACAVLAVSLHNHLNSIQIPTRAQANTHP